MPSESSEEKLIAAVTNLFRTLFEQQERFLVTNQSLRMLIDMYEPDLMTAARKGAGLKLLKQWTEEAPAFRQAWLRSNFAESVTFHGSSRKTLTESSVSDARAKCAERKRRARSRPRTKGTLG